MKFLRLFSSILLGSTVLTPAVFAQHGEFVNIPQREGASVRGFVAGPDDSNAGVLVVHDYFGITDATREAVDHLGGLGYRAMAIDLYGGEVGERS